MHDDERAIRDVIQRWMTATREGDVDAVLGLMTADVVFLVAGHPPMVGRDAFAAASRGAGTDGARPQVEGEARVEEVVVAGDVAYARTHLRVVTTPPGEGTPVRRSGHALSIFRREGDGAWRLARDANLLVPESPGA